MLITFDFPLVRVFSIFCLFASKKEKKILFYKWHTTYCRCPVRSQYERNASWTQNANREQRRNQMLVIVYILGTWAKYSIYSSLLYCNSLLSWISWNYSSPLLAVKGVRLGSLNWAGRTALGQKCDDFCMPNQSISLRLPDKDPGLSSYV